ncbi:hypothetical protein CPB97_004300 [Podila verticillata]|nr:hypothetical protein CPB97_004300 [Podila verticillata]
MYYRGANAAILVYDITSEDSFRDMSSWVEELRKNMSDDLIIHVVGNKLDLASVRRSVPISQTQEYVELTLGSDCVVHEVSAKDDDVERKNEIERNARLKAENAITLQQLEDERLLQSLASHENNSSVCCGI